MTKQQVNWAKQHDWFRSVQVLDTGMTIVWCLSQRPERGVVPFTDIVKLKEWAGY